jgi:LysM repeat protein
MSPETNQTTTKICPTCGSKNSENATRCLVCGRSFGKAAASNKEAKAAQGPRLPEITLNLPIAIALMVLLVGIGAAVVFGVLRGTGRVVEPTVTPTITTTPTLTLTPSPSMTASPLPTFTPLPPIEYTIKAGDYCSTIAAFFNVSLQSIVLLNNLGTDCGVLSVGQVLLIPQPTPTASPQPTSTLSGVEATDAACEKVEYTVAENDTLSGIANAYDVSAEVIKEYNGLTGDTVYAGRTLIIPLCERNPTPGPTPTATPPPPYLAPNLLLPADGNSYTSASDTITLQWASVGTLRENEAYQVTIIDVTTGTGEKVVKYETDTSMIVPISLRPSDVVPHIFRWTVQPVRKTGTDKDGQPIWESAGAISEARVFSWWSSTSATPTP